MSILVDQNTITLIQGITGKEGLRAAAEMLSHGMKVPAGVTPGKGGQRAEGVPVYDTVFQAIAKHPKINASLVTVPGAFVKDAAMEAIFAGIPLINILTEHVPVEDVATIMAWARHKGARVVGPSSMGIISPGKGKLGSIGRGNVQGVFAPGPFGVISKSGGMTSEISAILTRAGYGQTTAIGVGGDALVGTDYKDLLALFEEDRATKAVVMFGEIGGPYEEMAAEFILEGGFTKPLVAVIAGKFTKDLPKDTILGHAGAIVSAGRGGYDSKVKLLKKAGAYVAKTLDELPALAAEALLQSSRGVRPKKEARRGISKQRRK